jgi:hypothetical protein
VVFGEIAVDISFASAVVTPISCDREKEEMP